jgi:general secretion pathway protein L
MERILGSGVAAFFGWWFGELAALVPGWLRRRVRHSAEYLVFDVSGDEIVVQRIAGQSHRELGRIPAQPGDETAEAMAVSALVGRLNLDRLDVVLRLAAGNALRKSLHMPLAAADNLREVLSFEMDRQTPFTADQVYFDYHISARHPGTQRMDVELLACPRGDIDAAIERAAKWGVQPDIVDIAGAAETGDRPVNLLPRETGRTGAAGHAWLTGALAAIAVALAVTTVYLSLDRQRQAAETLQAEAAGAKAEADTALKLRKEIARLVQAGGYLANRRKNTPRVVEMVDELTGLMPDGTWLQNLRVRDGEVRISGFSAAASSLIGVIERSPLFAEARFRSPVTQDTRVGAERFTISARIAGGAPK